MRPKKDFKPWKNWKEDIYALYSEGAGNIEIRSLIAEKMEDTDTCSWDLWDRWLDEEPEFSDTIKRGQLMCETWWQNKGRTSLNDCSFSPTLWYMNMRNRFGWADKHETKSENNHTVTDLTEEEMDKKLIAMGVDPETLKK